MNKNEVAAYIVDIIDNTKPYKIARRKYDAEFARANSITLEDIDELRFVPCLECGEDISAKILLHKGNGMRPVYCSVKCRQAHSLRRLMKLNSDTDVNARAEEILKHCLQLMSGDLPKSTEYRATGKAIMMRTNELLAKILEELKNGNR